MAMRGRGERRGGGAAAGVWRRRDVVRALGLGAAGVSILGPGLALGCSGGYRSGRATAGRTATTRRVPPYDPSGVRLRRGSAQWYRNRYVRTPLAESGKDLLEFGGVPGRENNQSNVALIHHAGRLLSLGEVGWPFELSPSDLSTVGPWDFDGRLGETMTAHPKIDPATGRLHSFGYEFLRPALTYYAADAAGRIDVVSPVAVDVATMIHDFAITERDAVFWIGPVVFGADAAKCPVAAARARAGCSPTCGTARPTGRRSACSTPSR